MKRRIIALVVSCLAAVPLAAVPAQSAHAAGLDLQCVGGAELRFFPGLTNTPQSVEVFYNSTMTCTLVALIAGGEGASTFTIPDATCTDFLTIINTVNYRWYPRDGSTVRYTDITFDLLGVGQMVQIGTVTAGRFIGDRALDAIQFSNLDLSACNSPTGLTFASGPETLQLISL